MRNFYQTWKKITATLAAAAILGTALTGCTDTAAENQAAYKTIGINAMEAGDYEEAIKAFDRALEQSIGVIGSEEADICYYKADAQYRSGDTEAALATYNALLDYDDHLAEAHFLRGDLYLDQGDFESAMADYQAALSLDEKNLELYITICENLRNTGHEEEGTSLLTRATEISGNSAADHALRGRAYTLLGRYDEAAKELDEAIAGGDIDAKLYKGQLLVLTGDSAAAKPLFEDYLAERGEEADALNVLGCMAMESGDYPAALTYFESALSCAEESGVDPKEILRNRILAYEYNGQFAEAKAAMEEYAAAYELDSDFEKEYVFLSTR